MDYDSSVGRKVFQDPEGAPIASINKFNFNNDYYEDIVLVMQDGRIRLMEGAPTDPIFNDKGDIAFLSDGAVAVENFDFKEDGEYVIKITNIAENSIDVQIEFGNTNSQKMLPSGIMVLVGALVMMIMSYMKIKNYKIEQPEENIS